MMSDPFKGSFDSKKAMRRHADRIEDFNLVGMRKIMEKHGDQFPWAI